MGRQTRLAKFWERSGRPPPEVTIRESGAVSDILEVGNEDLAQEAWQGHRPDLVRLRGPEQNLPVDVCQGLDDLQRTTHVNTSPAQCGRSPQRVPMKAST